MISDDGSPILMDFGSTLKARIPIQNRSQALMQQVRLSPLHVVLKLMSLHIGHSCRAKHNGLSRSRAIRCQDWSIT